LRRLSAMPWLGARRTDRFAPQLEPSDPWAPVAPSNCPKPAYLPWWRRLPNVRPGRPHAEQLRPIPSPHPEVRRPVKQGEHRRAAVVHRVQRRHAAVVGHPDHRHIARLPRACDEVPLGGRSRVACSGHPLPRSIVPRRNGDGHGHDLWARPDDPAVCHQRESRWSVSGCSRAHRGATSEQSLVAQVVPA
jgi:hypothetical protein